MDVTNPGLVNVANQAFKPDLRVDSLAIPKDDDTLVPVADEGEPPAPNNPASQAVPFNDDTLVPVADQGEPRAENDVTSTIVPVPAESIVASQAAVPVSQDFGEVPGVAPAFLPFPPGPNDPDIAKQDLTAGNVSEFTVAGPDISIQTNQSAETQKNYAVTAVLDADTGLPPVIPVPPLAGTFSSVWDNGSGASTMVCPSVAGLSDGDAVAITGGITDYNGIYQISNVRNVTGSFDKAVISPGGTTTLASLTGFPGNLGSATIGTISGATNPAYNGDHALSNYVSRLGTVVAVYDNSAVLPGTILAVALSPTNLIDSQLISFSPGAYGGFHTVVAGTVNDEAGTFSSVSAGLGVVTIHVDGSTAGLVAGQIVTISSSAYYNGRYVISNVLANSFDIPFLAPFPGTDAGGWSTYTFVVDGTFAGTAVMNWYSNTIDIDAAFAGDSTGILSSFTFDIPVAFTSSTSGSWSRPNPYAAPTTRYQLVVAPPDLDSFGVSMLGRPIVFDDVIPTTANEGASRSITGYGANFVVIDRSDEADQLVPYMDNPQAGDTFILDVQRQGSEVISRGTGTTEDVTILPPPQVDVPTGIPSAPSQGNIEVSTGPQPGDPIITSGVNVPTAITVNIADQDLVGPGLPKDVFP